MTRRRGRRRKKLLDDLKDKRGYCQLKEEAVDHTVWRNCFGRGFGPIVWQITDDDDLINDAIFGRGRGDRFNIKRVSSFPTDFSEFFFHSKRNWATCDKYVYRSSCKVPVNLVRFWWNLDFLDNFLFENYSHIKFHKNTSSGSRVVPCGQTDGRTDMTKLIAPFPHFEKPPKN